jgi:hypothetical protein
MTPELWYLLWSAALTLILAVIAVSGATLKVGLPTLAGNRDGWARSWTVSIIGVILIFWQLLV